MGHFLPFTLPPKNPKSQNFEKTTKAAGDIIILHECTKNHNHMRYSSRDMDWDRKKVLSFWAIYCQFTPPPPIPLNPENQNFKTMKKESWEVITLHMCTKNHNNMMYASWDMEYDRHNFLSFWAIFCPFTPLLTPKIKIWNKFENNLDILSY